ncbi:adenylate/guanylate cyclase domain-containing protein [Marinoscillum furvescens]|uniref:Adenylate cyclase n=1 Tax=Marinoscillum furvescens DSM 4134 TaxID=1122208 RepID=A0A3D9LIB9_MARFU|nr:adenylate/guanylate cyclase domain-containing protein [Marinoscillum furvescens]REE05605.1 adenylate cyclase [Marinoscillum furvescens DSM 4134]
MQANYLDAEILKSEKKRLEVFIGFLLTTTLVTIFIQFSHYQILRDTFKNPVSYPLIIIATVSMVITFMIGRRWVIQLQKHNRKLPRKYYWYTVLLEVFIPSAWLVVASQVEETSALLDSPIIFLYYILIIVSPLHLDFWVSAAMGLLIALFFMGYTYWVTAQYPIDFHLPMVTYYLRSLMYFLAGILAGLVANELKIRLSRTNREIREKEEIEGLFNQQVSKEMVVALKEKKDFSARLDVTILFLDIRDFTQRVQHLSPEEVNKFQNEFFSPVIELINESKGIVNQITGDGLMATFGAPVTDKTHYNCAWMAVEKILDFLGEFRTKSPEHATLEIGMGLHCGEVLVGNIGTETRKQLSISGTPVIIASRIEQLNKELNSTVLISRQLFNLLKDKIQTFEIKGLVKMKGLDEEIEIIKVH